MREEQEEGHPCDAHHSLICALPASISSNEGPCAATSLAIHLQLRRESELSLRLLPTFSARPGTHFSAQPPTSVLCLAPRITLPFAITSRQERLSALTSLERARTVCAATGAKGGPERCETNTYHSLIFALPASISSRDGLVDADSFAIHLQQVEASGGVLNETSLVAEAHHHTHTALHPAPKSSRDLEQAMAHQSRICARAASISSKEAPSEVVCFAASWSSHLQTGIHTIGPPLSETPCLDEILDFFIW